MSISVSIAQALVKGSMRGNAIAIWHDAAKMAENYADEIEAGTMPARDGPGMCRLLAAFYRGIADGPEHENGT